MNKEDENKIEEYKYELGKYQDYLYKMKDHLYSLTMNYIAESPIQLLNKLIKTNEKLRNKLFEVK